MKIFVDEMEQSFPYNKNTYKNNKTMRKNKPNYTQKEIEIIVSCIKESPTNLQKGFQKASNIVGRPANSISALYYNRLKKNKSLFNIVSDKTYKSNVKNQMRKKEPTSGFSIRLTFDNIKDAIMSMSKDQKQDIFKSLVSEVI
jgi:nickel-dependent lactate racemase